MTASSWLGGQRVETPCTIEIEHSDDFLHALFDLQGAAIGPGDSVELHGAPALVPFGSGATFRGSATVHRASLAGRVWTRLSSYLFLTELLEIGFSAGRKE